MAATVPLTADELLRLSLPNKRAELVRGVLVVREPAGFEHGRVAGALLVAIALFVKAHDLGVVLAAETGFKLFSDPDTVRAPDVAFVAKGRLPKGTTQGYAPIAPDLAVEVLSPDDRPGKVREKVDDWLVAGTRLIWIVDPVKRLARIHRADGTEAEVNADGELDGEDVLPGFVCALADAL